LEPLSGFLTLGALLAADRRYETAFNFGPSTQDVRRVSDLVDSLIRHWGSGSWEDVSSPDQLHEATTLSLNCDKAFQSLGWQPVWHFDRTVAETASWFKALQEGTAMQSFTLSQLATYVDDARLAGVPWAQGSKESE
jgi:CDP-glucose 4,6-dehydratase